MAQCVDDVDFKLDANGRLELNPVSEQNDPEEFVFTLDGAQDVFEKVTSFTDVPVPEDGWYLVIMEAHGNAAITPALPGTVVNAAVSAQLRRNNVVVAGTETMLTLISQGAPQTNQPALQTHGTGSCSRILFLNAGDDMSIWGKRNSDPGTTSEIISNDDGRCRITMVRFGGL